MCGICIYQFLRIYAKFIEYYNNCHNLTLRNDGLVAPYGDWHISGSTLAQVVAWCRQAPSHYLNQCWLISEVIWHSPEGDFAGNAQDIYLWYKFGNDWFKITAASAKEQWVKSHRLILLFLKCYTQTAWARKYPVVLIKKLIIFICIPNLSLPDWSPRLPVLWRRSPASERESGCRSGLHHHTAVLQGRNLSQFSQRLPTNWHHSAHLARCSTHPGKIVIRN